MSDQVVSENKMRNYSFLHKKEDSLDSVETENEEFIIPAQNGSCYWAILKTGYLSHDEPIALEDYIDRVAELLESRDPLKWDKFKNKNRVKTLKNGEVVEKDANDWRKRIATNIRTLTRSGGNNAYGRRLIERGHILRWEPHHFNGKGGFVLRTTTNEPLPLKRGKAPKKEITD